MHNRINKYTSKQLCFYSLVIFICGAIILQWMYLSYDRERRLLIEQIQHFGEVIIPGWESNKTLANLQKYYRPGQHTTKLSGLNICSLTSFPQVLLIVSSPIQNYDYRVAIRNTWGHEAFQRYNVSVAFMVGVSLDENVNERIRNENHLYQDLIVEDFIDSNFNNTLKSIFTLKWTIHNCPQAEFLMKTVDNAFINVDNLHRFVNDPSRILPRLLVGKLVTGQSVIRDSLKDRYMPTYMYPYEKYPDYVSGAGYLMVMETVELLYEKVRFTSYVYLEDVFITGLCAESAGITRYYDFRFYFIELGSGKMDCDIIYQQNLIVHSHSIDTTTMYQDYNELNKCLALKIH